MKQLFWVLIGIFILFSLAASVLAALGPNLFNNPISFTPLVYFLVSITLLILFSNSLEFPKIRSVKIMMSLLSAPSLYLYFLSNYSPLTSCMDAFREGCVGQFIYLFLAIIFFIILQFLVWGIDPSWTMKRKVIVGIIICVLELILLVPWIGMMLIFGVGAG